MTFSKLLKLQSLGSIGILATIAAVPVGCTDDSFTGCEASRTCPTKVSGGSAGDRGEAGEHGDAGGSGAAGSGSGGQPGSSTGGESGEGGQTTGGTAGGSGEGGRTDGGEGGVPNPPEGPAVISVSPADGEVGVDPDVDLTITFSEPMNRETTQAAFDSPAIAPEMAIYSWSADSTVLTIDPIDDLDFYEVSELTDISLNYTASITNEAQARSGARLAADFEWSFRTVRRITHTIAVPPENSFVVYNDSSTAGSACPGQSVVFAGDGINVSTFILVSVDITSLPATILSWESATLSAQQTSVQGAPFDSLGLLRAYHMDVNPPPNLTWQTPNLGSLGVFSASPELTIRSLDVRTPLTEDWVQRTARNQHSQYKLAFDQATDSDGVPDRALYACDGFTLTARYLAP